jgi:hypothetical protein
MGNPALGQAHKIEMECDLCGHVERFRAKDVENVEMHLNDLAGDHKCVKPSKEEPDPKKPELERWGQHESGTLRDRISSRKV